MGHVGAWGGVGNAGMGGGGWGWGGAACLPKKGTPIGLGCVMQGWVYNTGVGWVMQGWGGSLRGGVGHAGVG